MDGKRMVLWAAVVVFSAGVASAQSVWIDDPVNPVLPPGDPGEWDEGGRLPGTVIWDGSLYHMWFGGYSSENPPLEQGIGHATSPDGVVWTMDGNNPGLEDGEPGQWDDWLVYPSAAVTYDGMQFHFD